jgi:predicted dehydrogenase
MDFAPWIPTEGSIMSRVRKLERRTFLRRATAVTIGCLGAPHVISSSALGNASALPPSERVTLAFLGPGHRGTQLVREFAGRHDVEPLAVCDVRRDQRERIAALVGKLAGENRGQESYEGCKTYIDFREVLARRDIEAVVVSAPEHWRPIMCILAARAGKDIFTEKPFALTIKEGQAMVETIRRYGRIFQHGTQRRSNNEARLRDSCELVRNGRIGKVTHAVVTVGPAPQLDFPDYTSRLPLPRREDFDWDLWLGPAPWRPYPGTPGVPRWQRRLDFGLGSIGNWGSHTLDMAQWALGRDAEGPVEILPPTKGEPRLVIGYADGVRIYCPRTPGDSVKVSVFGTEGQKTIFGNPGIEEKYDRTPLGPGDTPLYRPERNDHNGDWLRAIRTRKKTICNEEVGYRSGSLCMLMAVSDRLRRPLEYDPVKAEFPGDEEANRLLDTPKRAPWKIY